MWIPRRQHELLIFFIFCVQLLRTGSAIRCYRCSSPYNGECADPVRNHVQLYDCDLITPKASSCKKMIRYFSNTTYIIRDCTSQAETESGEGCFQTNKKDEYCRCFTDACNAQDAFTSCLHWTIASILASRLYKYYYVNT